jgi:intein/homing endonuclease
MSLSLAEFLGLMVADGSIFQSGFRLMKRHEDVVDRFEFLCAELFSATCTRFFARGAFGCEVSSTYIRSWLESIGGLDPNRKHVPQQVLDSSLRFQRLFLRGLFEDGTVNVKGDRLDHVALTTAYVEMARTVQMMLLESGIISSVFEVLSQGHRSWRVNIYGYNASLFAERIRFVSSLKNEQLQTPSGPENRYLIPVDGSTVGDVPGKPWMKANARHRGYVSRDAARQLGLMDALKFHHERIESILTEGGFR